VTRSILTILYLLLRHETDDIHLHITLLSDNRRRYTCHIPTETGEAVTRCLQHNLSYQINVPHDRLMTWMDKLTDFHPFAIAPKSDRVYRPPKNPKGDNLADLINGLMLAGAQ
jgi:hypothetical protein